MPPVSTIKPIRSSIRESSRWRPYGAPPTNCGREDPQIIFKAPSLSRRNNHKSTQKSHHASLPRAVLQHKDNNQDSPSRPSTSTSYNLTPSSHCASSLPSPSGGSAFGRLSTQSKSIDSQSGILDENPASLPEPRQYDKPMLACENHPSAKSLVGSWHLIPQS